MSRLLTKILAFAAFCVLNVYCDPPLTAVCKSGFTCAPFSLNCCENSCYDQTKQHCVTGDNGRSRLIAIQQNRPNLQDAVFQSQLLNTNGQLNTNNGGCDNWLCNTASQVNRAQPTYCQPPKRYCPSITGAQCYDPREAVCRDVTLLCPFANADQTTNPIPTAAVTQPNVGSFGPQQVSTPVSQQQTPVISTQQPIQQVQPQIGPQLPQIQLPGQSSASGNCANPDYVCQAHLVCDPCLVLVNGGDQGDANNKRFLNTMCPNCLKLQQCDAQACQAREMCEVCKVLEAEHKEQPYVCSLTKQAC
jgi:hypothetical protein